MKCLTPTKFSSQSGFQRCGNCINCRITRQNEWLTRLLLEYKYHARIGSFVTLTYAPEYLPESNKYKGGNLQKSAIQKFLKRLRKNYTKGLRMSYFAVGEYGTLSSRAHYHLIIYGVDPVKLEALVKKSWPYGLTQTIDLAKDGYNRMRYTLGYTLKKMTQEKDYPDGRQPEFALMSRKPALGASILPSFVPYLIKNGIYPSRGIDDRQKYYIEKNYPKLKPWNGVFKENKKNYILDKFLSAKLYNLVYTELQEEYENYVYGNIKNDWRYVSNRNRRLDDSYLDTIKFMTGEEHEEEKIKSDKKERQIKSRHAYDKI